MSNSEFKFYCFHCDQPLKCDPCHAGRQIQCPGCNHLIGIPNPPAGTGFTHVHPESGQTWATTSWRWVRQCRHRVPRSG